MSGCRGRTPPPHPERTQVTCAILGVRRGLAHVPLLVAGACLVALQGPSRLVMPRKLKYHEQRLLRKVDFLNWKQDSNLREVKILRRYHVQDREDYHSYNKITGVVTQVPAAQPRPATARHARRPAPVSPPRASLSCPPSARQLVAALQKLDQRDPVRAELTDALVDKLYALGLVPQKRLLACVKLPASSFCRRRLPVVMVRLRMAETVKQAAELVEQGHVRVGPESVTDPAFLITRAMEDHVTWVDTSRIKRTVMKYNEKLDDFDML